MCCIGTVLTNSRTYWALARDNAVPLSGLLSKVNERLSCPIPATLFVCEWAMTSCLSAEPSTLPLESLG